MFIRSKKTIRIFLLAAILIAGSLPGHSDEVDAQFEWLRSGRANTEPVAQLEFVSQVGGAIQAVAVQGTTAFIGSGTRLGVIDISNPAAPQWLGRGPGQDQPVTGVAVSGELAATTLGRAGLALFDVSAPASPRLAGYLDTADYAHMVAFVSPSSGQLYALVADGSTGVLVLDVTAPASPAILAQVDTPGNARSLVADWPMVYIADGDSVLRLDFSNLAAPVMSVLYSYGSVVDLALSGNILYAAADSYGVHILDITAPTDVRLLKILAPDGRAQQVLLSGTRLFVGAGNYAGLSVFNISNPAAAAYLGSYALQGSALDLAPYNSTVLLAGQTGLYLLNAADPAGAYQLAAPATTYGAMDVALAGDHAYLATSGALRVLDISSPAVASVMGSLEFFMAGDLRGIALGSDYAYLANGSNGLLVADIGSPTHPVQAGQLSGFSAYDIALAGNHAYLASGPDGVTIVDVTQPLTPTLVTTYDTPGNTLKLRTAGDFLYVADQYTVLILDIRDPASPSLVASIPIASRDVEVAANLIYIIGGRGLFIFDHSAPSQLAFLGALALGASTKPVGIHVQGSLAYLSQGSAGLSLVDVSNPANPAYLGSYNTPGEATAVQAAPPYAYLADGNSGELLVLDTYDPAGLALTSQIVQPIWSHSVEVDQGTAYLAARDQGVFSIAVTDLGQPASLNSVNTYGAARAVALAPPNASGERFAYVASGLNPVGLPILEITDPSQLALAGNFSGPAYSGPLFTFSPGYEDLAVLSNRAYLRSYFALEILDISNPISPTLLGSLASETILSYAIAVGENHQTDQTIAYMAQDGAGLVLVDVTNPAAPAVLNQVSLPGIIMDIAVQDNLAVVSTKWDGLFILDVSDPLAPDILESNLNQGAFGAGVTLDGHLAYVTNGETGLHIFDLGNPANPVEVAYFDPPSESMDVAVSDGYAYLSDYLYGLVIVRAPTTQVALPDEPATLGTSDGEVQLEIPAATFPLTTTLSLIPQLAPTHLTGQLAFGGISFRALAYDSDGNPVTSLAQPVTVTLSYNDADIAGLDETQLRLYRWDETALEWQDAAHDCSPASTYQRDLDANQVSLALCHLSEFALLEYVDLTRQVYLPAVIHNFPPLYNIQGRVLTGAGLPLVGVTIACSSGGQAVTGLDGTYTLPALAGTYTLTPQHPEWLFTPASRVVTVPPEAANVDFTAAPACQELIINGGFETQEGWLIAPTGVPAGYDTTLFHSGARAMRTGILDPDDNQVTDSYVTQTFTLPERLSSARLRFWLYPISGVIAEFNTAPLSVQLADNQYVYLLNSSGAVVQVLVSQRESWRTWMAYDFDLGAYAGQTIGLRFGTFNNGLTGVAALYADDVSLEVCP